MCSKVWKWRKLLFAVVALVAIGVLVAGFISCRHWQIARTLAGDWKVNSGEYAGARWTFAGGNLKVEYGGGRTEEGECRIEGNARLQWYPEIEAGDRTFVCRGPAFEVVESGDGRIRLAVWQSDGEKSWIGREVVSIRYADGREETAPNSPGQMHDLYGRLKRVDDVILERAL